MTRFGGQTFSNLTQNRLAAPYERLTGREYPWYYYEPETELQRNRRLTLARIRQLEIEELMRQEQIALQAIQEERILQEHQRQLNFLRQIKFNRRPPLARNQQFKPRRNT